jgi:hypothetical protein
MNAKLLEQIVLHIFANFAIIKSDFVNIDKTKSLLNKDFLLDKNLIFEDDDSEIKNKVWGCQVSSDNQKIIILLGELSLNKDEQEFCLLVKMNNAPTYCLYLNLDDSAYFPMIACSLDGENWMQCSTFLQASFLAGMERVKDLNFHLNKCNDYEGEFEHMKSFINYHYSYCEAFHEGQED